MKKVELAVICGLIITIIAGSISGFSAFAKQCDDIRGSVLRLHILANSDSKADQQLKLNVRDAILKESGELFKTSSSKAEAIENVKAKLDEIKKVAEKETRREGYAYSVNAELVNMYFNTRTYGNVTLPAGNYDAVRISIGKAKGHNWWCVLFPPLCLPAAEQEVNPVNIDDVLNQNEANIVKGNKKPDIEIKFKTVEVFEEAKDFFSNLFSNKK